MNSNLTFQKINKNIPLGVSAVFIDENYNLNHLSNFLSKNELNKINFKLKEIKKNKNKIKFSTYDLSEKIKLIFVKILSSHSKYIVEQTGANFSSFLKDNNLKVLNVISITSKKIEKKNTVLDFVHGFNLKSYSFTKYQTSYKNLKTTMNIFSINEKNFKDDYSKYQNIELGVHLTRDLVSEPPNILTPKKYVEIIKQLTSYGIKVTVYNEKQLKKMGMNAILGVGQGSINESYLVTMEWHGDKKSKDKPLSFVGKGVCFDTGGISLKPAKFMEEMKYDMAGSAVVVGLLKTLALRKAKINAVGVVGLVENMPGGNAQRPGDIVKSYSGKTIEILNTDAEGRLVLADALSFTEKKFNPKFIIDLATLTGAIIVSLGEEYAGLFSNSDQLSDRLFKLGDEMGEKVWRLPLHNNYNKLMNSTVADVQNINYSGGAGSITAAEFLQRFILKKTPWVHLDIAGMAFAKKAANLNPSGATGFGVRLLNKLCEEYYE